MVIFVSDSVIGIYYEVCLNSFDGWKPCYFKFCTCAFFVECSCIVVFIKSLSKVGERTKDITYWVWDVVEGSIYEPEPRISVIEVGNFDPERFSISRKLLISSKNTVKPSKASSSVSIPSKISSKTSKRSSIVSRHYFDIINYYYNSINKKRAYISGCNT